MTATGKQVVMSVPHSGTRSLMDHLGIYAREQDLRGAGNWWHFGNHEYLVRRHEPHLHIPVRHPMDVAASWARREKSGEPLRNLIMRYEIMFGVINAGYPHTLHRVEDIPRTKGMGEHAPGNRDSLVRRFQERVREEIVEPHRAFFTQFYEDPFDGAGFVQ